MVQPLHFHFYSAGPVFNNICIVSIFCSGRWSVAWSVVGAANFFSVNELGPT